MKIISREISNIIIRGNSDSWWDETWGLNNNLYVLAEHSNNTYSFLRFKLADDRFIPSEYIYKFLGDETNHSHYAVLSQVINGFTIKTPHSQFMEYMACIESIDPELFKFNQV